MVDGRDLDVIRERLRNADWDSPPPPPPRVEMPFEFTPVKANWEFDHAPRYTAIMDEIHGRIMLLAQIRVSFVDWMFGRFFLAHPGLFFQILAHHRRTSPGCPHCEC